MERKPKAAKGKASRRERPVTPDHPAVKVGSRPAASSADGKKNSRRESPVRPDHPAAKVGSHPAPSKADGKKNSRRESPVNPDRPAAKKGFQPAPSSADGKKNSRREHPVRPDHPAAKVGSHPASSSAAGEKHSRRERPVTPEHPAAKAGSHPAPSSAAGRKNAPAPAAGEAGHTPCPVYRKCGGCQLQNLSYPRQLAWKQDRCQKLLGKFGKVSPILGMDCPYHYRNKVQAAFHFDKRHGRIVSGVYQSSTHRIVPIDSCQTEDETADRIIVSVRKLLKDFKLTAFDETTGRGFLRHVLVKRGFTTGQVMVVLVTGTPVFTAKKHFVAELLRLHPEITTILQNVNDRYTSMVLGDREKVLYGPGYIVDQLCGCKFRISAKSFYQINPLQTEVLYNKAMEFAGLTGKEKVLDAYCGIGTIGLVAASRGAAQVLGVELNPDAVKDAIQNAKENGVKNAYFTCGDAGEFLEEAALQGERWDVVFMDPPRAGASREFLTALAACAPRRVVYISCDPETLSRDLGILQANHYRIEKIQPVDMFPHTQHVETVVLMSKVKGR